MRFRNDFYSISLLFGYNNYFDGMDGKSLKMWHDRWVNSNVSANKLNDKIEANKQFWIEKIKEYPCKTRHFF